MSSSWARRRKIYYALGVLGFFSIIFGPIIFFSVYEPPTCFDGKLNQTETAIDRGGPCRLIDENSLQAHAALWSRSFPVRDGFYNALAYIENPNPGAGVFDAAYQFKLYDDRNILIAERFGRVPLLPGKVFPIFESRIDTGNRVPVRTFFTFVNRFAWEKMEDPTDGILVYNEHIAGADTSPRLTAMIENTRVGAIDNMVFVATLFDSAANAFASSRTVVEHLEPGERKEITFTWPHAFSQQVARIDLVPLRLPER